MYSDIVTLHRPEAVSQPESCLLWVNEHIAVGAIGQIRTWNTRLPMHLFIMTVLTAKSGDYVRCARQNYTTAQNIHENPFERLPLLRCVHVRYHAQHLF